MRDPATQPNLENYEPVAVAEDTPAGGYPGGATNYPPAPNPLLRSPLPPSQQTAVDQLRQFYRIGTPQNRTLPLQPNASPANNAASQTIAQSVSQTIINNTPNPVTLTMPAQYTVSGSPGNNLGVQWLPVTPGVVLAGPGPISAWESIVPNTLTNNAILNAEIVPGQPTAWILWVEWSDNNVLPGQPAGWTQLRSSSSQNVFYQNVTSTNPVSLNAQLSNPSSCISILMAFAGPFPPLIQSGGGTIVGSGGGATINVTAGNVLWVVGAAYNGAVTYTINVSDTLNNTFDLVNGEQVGGGGHPVQSQNIFVCPVINATGATTISVNYIANGTASPPDHKEFFYMETGPLTPGNGLPFFRQLSPSELPPLPNLDGILQVAKGGTGLTNPSLVAGTNITITGSWPDQTINAAGGGGSPGGSAGDVQINNSGAFGTATNIIPGASINVNSGVLAFTGGVGISVTGGPLTVSAASSGNINLRTNLNIQIDSNGGHVLLGTVFSSSVEVGGASSQLGFFGSSGNTQQTVTGSRGGNAALASLLTGLAAMNLIVDSSTP